MTIKNCCPHGMNKDCCRICNTNTMKKTYADDLFFAHEAFMVTLCSLLGLSYEESTEKDVLDEVKKLVNFALDKNTKL